MQRKADKKRELYSSLLRKVNTQRLEKKTVKWFRCANANGPIYGLRV